MPFSKVSGSIPRYYGYLTETAPALTDPWIEVEPNPDVAGMFVVNRTLRYRNKAINYRFLSNRSDVVFVGNVEEYRDFCIDVRCVPHYPTPDYITLARTLAGAKAVIANQSFCFALCEAMKCSRILEVYPHCPNVVPTGPNAADFHTQSHLERLVECLTE